MKDNFQKYMLLLCIAGAMLSMYLYYTDIVKVAAVCPTDGCAKVAASEYSRFLGIPVSLWGFLYYIGFASVFILRDFIDLIKKYTVLLSGIALGIGILFTIYLRFVEFYYIHAICIWCWGSVLIMVLLTITYLLSMKGNGKRQEN